MARQLIFTSAPQGLTPGRTGFCTVARHADLRDRLVPLLEGLGVYPSGWQPPPVICSYRLLDVGGARVPVLTRVVDAGQDYTHRTSFLAHHLILDPAETAAAPSPAEIFLRWPGWRTRWEGPPRWLGAADLVDLRQLPPPAAPALPAQTWLRLTGDAGCAALLVEGGLVGARPLRVNLEREGDVLALFRESAALLDPADAWRAEFITCLPSVEQAASYKWLALRAGSPADAALPGLLDLTPGAEPLRPPATPSAQSARDGKITARPVVTSPPPSPAPKAPVVPAWPGLVPAIRPAYAARPGPSWWRANGWALALIVVLLISIAVLGAFWRRGSAPPSPLVENPPPTLAPVASILAPPPPARAVAPPIVPGPLPTPVADNDNQNRLENIKNLGAAGQWLDALAAWRALVQTGPDFAAAQSGYLQTTLLPGARPQWLKAVGDIVSAYTTASLDAPGRAALAARLAGLRDFPTAWPVDDPAALTAAWQTAADQLATLDRLPDAPTWLVDPLEKAAVGPDYTDYSATIALPDLLQFLATPAADSLHAAFAPAVSLALPPADQWFHFDIRAGDFSSGDFLVLNDASRGAAGGRFLQLLIEGTGAARTVRLTWRAYAPGADFFASYSANAPLAAPTGRFWLRLSGPPPSSELLLLITRADADPATWQPLALPQAWLAVAANPPAVALPAWLSRNLPLHAVSPSPYWLVPESDTTARAAAFAAPLGAAAAPAAAHFRNDWLVNAYEQQARSLQADDQRARQNLQKAQNDAAAGPFAPPGAQADVDRAQQVLTKMDDQIAAANAAAQAAARPDWPRALAPWVLLSGPDARHTTPLIEFTADATGSPH